MVGLCLWVGLCLNCLLLVCGWTLAIAHSNVHLFFASRSESMTATQKVAMDPSSSQSFFEGVGNDARLYDGCAGETSSGFAIPGIPGDGTEKPKREPKKKSAPAQQARQVCLLAMHVLLMQLFLLKSTFLWMFAFKSAQLL